MQSKIFILRIDDCSRTSMLVMSGALQRRFWSSRLFFASSVSGPNCIDEEALEDKADGEDLSRSTAQQQGAELWEPTPLMVLGGPTGAGADRISFEEVPCQSGDGSGRAEMEQDVDHTP